MYFLSYKSLGSEVRNFVKTRIQLVKILGLHVFTIYLLFCQKVTKDEEIHVAKREIQNDDSALLTNRPKREFTEFKSGVLGNYEPKTAETGDGPGIPRTLNDFLFNF